MSTWSSTRSRRSAREQDLLHPAAALARLHLEEAILFLAEEDHLFPLAEGGHDLARVRRLRHDPHIADLGPEHVALVEDGAGLLLAAGRRFLGKRAHVALEARIGAHGAHDAVVVVGEARRDHLALVRVRVTAQPHAGGDPAAHAAEQATELEVGLARAAFGRGHLDPRAAVRERHARLGLLELETTGHAAPDAARIVLGEGYGGGEDVVGRHHLATAHVRVLAKLAGFVERTLLHHVLHAHAALDHDEAVRLLDHEANEAYGGAELIAREGPPHVVLRLHHGHRAHGLVAALEVGSGARRPARAGRSLDGATALALLHVRDALCVGRGGHRESARQ